MKLKAALILTILVALVTSLTTIFIFYKYLKIESIVDYECSEVGTKGEFTLIRIPHTGIATHIQVSEVGASQGERATTPFSESTPLIHLDVSYTGLKTLADGRSALLYSLQEPLPVCNGQLIAVRLGDKKISGVSITMLTQNIHRF